VQGQRGGRVARRASSGRWVRVTQSLGADALGMLGYGLAPPARATSSPICGLTLSPPGAHTGAAMGCGKRPLDAPDELVDRDGQAHSPGRTPLIPQFL
jgi:hypothetical protein